MSRLRLTPPPAVAGASAPDYGEIFLAHAGRLRRIALRLVDRHADVEDLLQDACVQFVVAQPDLDAIEDLDSYLASLVRNLHLSRQRRRVNQRQWHVALSDYDTAELALRASDGDRLIAREGLTRICAHLCVRKETSRAASVLALRFVHGFFPAEIAAIARVPYRAVRDWLRQAREEARQVLAQRIRIAPGGLATVVALPSIASDDPEHIIVALRQALFAARRSACPVSGALEGQYGPESTPMDTSTLAHVVSCAACLERACRRLSLPDEGDRTGGDDGRQGADKGARPTPRRSGLRGVTRRVRQVIEHTPRRLSVSVNGLVVGGVAVEGPRTDVQWAVRIDEPIVFVELLSEQAVLMAHLVLVPLPAGAVVQTLRVSLADDRWIGLSIDQTGMHPVASVHYEDPSYGLDADTLVPHVDDAERPATPAPRRFIDRIVSGIVATLARVAPLRPGFVPAIATLAALGATAVIVLDRSGAWRFRQPATEPPAPAILLDAAAAREQVLPTGEVRHRVLSFAIEGDGGARYRIEAWDTIGGRHAVRVFDGSGQLVAGEWTDASNGTRLRPLGVFDDVWRDGLAAGPFRQRVANAACTTVTEADHYVIDCESARRAAWVDLLLAPLHAEEARTDAIRARLFLRTGDLHADRLDLTVVAAGHERTLRIDEALYAVVPSGELPAGTFAAPPEPSASVTSPTRESAVEASPSLEMRLLDTVDRLGASSQVEIGRTAAGQLRVSGHTPTAAGRQRLVATINELAGPAAVTTDLLTAAEADARARRAQTATSALLRAEVRTLPDGAAPFEAYLERRSAYGGNAAAVVHELAPRVLEQARQSLFDARSIESLLERFPASTTARLDSDGRAAWRAFVVRHADACTQALERLDAAVADYFPADPSQGDALASSVDELAHQLAHEATLVYESAASAFTASDGTAPPGVVRSDFRSHVRRTLSLSRAIQAALTWTP